MRDMFRRNTLHKRSFAVFCVLAFAAFAHAGPDLALSSTPVFIGMADGDCFPLRIMVANKGPDATGEVTVRQSGVVLHYPIQLPRGSTKAFIAYPTATTFESPMQIVLDTNQGVVREEWTNPAGFFEGRQVLDITDNAGEAGFLKSNGSAHGMSVQDIYGKPEVLPDRGAGYGTIFAVILGSGSERMSDASVEALKQYVTTGGKLVFIGGASPGVVRDPRWASLCPVTGLRTQNLSDPTVQLANVDFQDETGAPGALLSYSIQGSATEAVGAPREAAAPIVPSASGESSVCQALCMPVGAGFVYFFGLNPFEEPLSSDLNRATMISYLIGLQRGVNARSQVVAYSGAAAISDPYSHGYYSAPSGGGYSGYSYNGSDNDPFSVHLPDTKTVGAILILYVLIVAPFNLLALKKFGRSQWAWISAPIISIVFAGVFFRFAGSLYAASLSNKTTGLVIADKDSPDATVLGDSQLFFPRGGNYDLKLSNVELVNNQDMGRNRYDSGGMNGPDTEDLNAVDTGTVFVPGLRTTNLGFHEVSFRERAAGAWPQGNLHLNAHLLTGEITNVSRYTLEDPEVFIQKKLFVLDDLKPGETKRIKIEGQIIDTNTFEYGNADTSNQSLKPLFTALSKDRFVLKATIKDFEAGPRIGRRVEGGKLVLFENLGKIQP